MLERAEIARRDDLEEARGWRRDGSEGAAGNAERHPESPPLQRQRGGHRRLLDAGHGAHHLDGLIHIVVQALAVDVTPHHQWKRHRHDVCRIETGIDAGQAVEAANEQSCTAQQHERQRHLRDDQRVAQGLAPAAAGSAPSSFFQGFDRIALRCLQRREDSEEDSR